MRIARWVGIVSAGIAIVLGLLALPPWLGLLGLGAHPTRTGLVTSMVRVLGAMVFLALSLLTSWHNS